MLGELVVVVSVSSVSRVFKTCFKSFKGFFCCDFKANGWLVSLCLVFKIPIIYFKISHIVLEVFYF